jgi:phosphatidylglycerol---prolipoprotein diacylglyceryl transferase
MIPILFRIGSFEVSSFGVLVALGVLLALYVFRRELRRSGLDEHAGTDAAVIGVVAGLLGAKLLFVAEHTAEPLADTLLARGGMSWFGGFVGGVLGGSLALLRKRVPFLEALSAASPALAAGQAVGRIGCFLVGDDYGRPSTLPWAVAFPEGLPPTTVPVHPTQIYEAAGLALLAWALVRWRRSGPPPARVLGVYLIGAGALRFAIEFVRVNTRVLDGLTVAHFFSAAVVLAGLLLQARTRTASERSSRNSRP